MVAEEPTSVAAPTGSDRDGHVLADDETLHAGSLLGRYVITAPAGAGGMSVVYEAYDPELHRRVAVKLLQPGRRAQERLEAEARALARLSHPNVVQVYDVGAIGGRLYLVQEYIDAGTLGRWLAERRRGWREIVAAFVMAGRGLAAAHAAGIVHADVKPDNILVGSDGRARVTDFGLARDAGEEDALPGAGTPAYMSPEQKRGQTDARSDQYSFAVALHEALHGALPGRPRPSGRRLPAWLERVVQRGMRPEPGARFPSMAALVDALARDPLAGLRHAALVAVAVALVGALSTGAFLARRSREALCRAAATDLAGVWDDGRRAELERAFLATGLPFARESYAATRAALDGWAGRYAALGRESCEATRLRGVQSETLLDRRMACLGRRRQEVAALVEVLARGDREAVTHAVEASSRVAPLAPCADTAALLAATAPPPPAEAAAVAGVAARLARATALEAAGELLPARQAAEAVVASAAGLSHAPARAEAALVLGRIEGTLGDSAAAAGHLQDAAFAAQTAGADRTAVQALSLLAASLGDASRFDAARFAGRQAEALLGRLGGDRLLEADLAGNRCSLEEDAGELAAAREQCARALAGYEARQPFGLESASVHRELAMIEGRLKHLAEADLHVRLALAILVARLGPEHPRVADARLVLVTRLLDRDRSEDAVAEARQALAVFARVSGPESRDVATAEHNLGSALWRAKRFDDAAQHLRRAVEIDEKALGPTHAVVGDHLSMLAGPLMGLRRFDEAAAALRRAIAIYEAARGAQHPMVVTMRGNLGTVLYRAGRLDEARPLLERAVADASAAYGPDSDIAGASLVTLGHLARTQRRLPDAASAYERALAIGEKRYGADAPRLAGVLVGLGATYLDLGAPGKALPLLERGLALQERLPPDPATLEDARRQLARARRVSR